MMGMEPAKRLGCVANFGFQPAVITNVSGIAHLAAAFAVERRLIGDDSHFVTGLGAIDAGAILDQREHPALAFMAGVASEFGRAMFLGDVEPEVVRGLLARTLPGGAGSGLLLGHGDVERSEEHTSELQSLMRNS